MIDNLWLSVRRSDFLYRFTLFTRILLATSFLPTGLIKLLGHRFTSLPVETPVGNFFEALYRAGPYWRFIGATQVMAAILLLVPRFAHLGALLFLPVIANIFVITVALEFTGTPFVTGPMLLAAIYLCAWDWNRFRPLFFRTDQPASVVVEARPLDRVELAGFWVFALSLMSFFLVIRGLLPREVQWLLPAIAAVGGLVALGRYGYRLARK